MLTIECYFNVDVICNLRVNFLTLILIKKTDVLVCLLIKKIFTKIYTDMHPTFLDVLLTTTCVITFLMEYLVGHVAYITSTLIKTTILSK